MRIKPNKNEKYDGNPENIGHIAQVGMIVSRAYQINKACTSYEVSFH